MAETQTIAHDLKKYDDGDNPGASNLNFNWDVIDLRLWGSGISFPTEWPIGGIFVRIDEMKVYQNIGTIVAPVWNLILSGSVGANTIAINGSRLGRVPSSSGILFLQVGEVVTSSAGFTLAGKAGILRDLSIVVDVADATNDYRLDVVRDPTTGSPIIVGSVALLSGNRKASATLSQSIPANVELGFRIVRTAGSGVSDFLYSVATANFEI